MGASHVSGPFYSAAGFVGDLTGNVTLPTGLTATTLAVTTTSTFTGVVTLTAQPILSSLTASLPVFTDASKGLVSGTATGTGAVVLAASPTITGTPKIANPVNTHTPTAANADAVLTAAQVAAGYITSTSAAATALTLPTGTLLGTELGAVQGTVFDLYIDNTAGANTVTMVVAVNGILSALAAAEAGGSGLLTVPNGVTGQGCFRLMFSSATAYTFSRIA